MPDSQEPQATFGTYEDPFLRVVSSAPYPVDVSGAMAESKSKGIFWLLLLALLIGVAVYETRKHQ